MVIHPHGIKYIVVHCSATPPDRNIGAKEIDRWHRDKQYFKIGYHFVLRRDGTVEKGRGLTEIGAHAAGYNSMSWGICLVGGVNKDLAPENNFTLDQFAALGQLLIDLKSKAPQAEIIGHRDLPRVRKACPSFDVREWVAATLPNLGDQSNAN